MADEIKWSDGKPSARKGNKDKLRATPGASFASVGKNKLTVYRVQHSPKGEVWHAAVNGKRIESSFKNIGEAKTAAAKAAV